MQTRISVLFLFAFTLLPSTTPAADLDLQALVGQLNGKNVDSRIQAADALGDLGPLARDAVPALVKALQADDLGLRHEVAIALGNIGPEAALPVMEGKAILFKEFADIDAIPLVVNTQSPEELIAVAKAVAPTFGGINLEDIGAPNCFIVEDALQDLGIPVFHDYKNWVGAPAASCSMDLENPYLGDRSEMLHRLAWAQWTWDEIESGEAVKWLL